MDKSRRHVCSTSNIRGALRWTSSYVRRRTECFGEKVEIAKMNQEQMEGKWRQFRGALRERWGEWKADQCCVDSARREQSAGRALELYGINKQESQRALREFWHRNRRWDVTDR